MCWWWSDPRVTETSWVALVDHQAGSGLSGIRLVQVVFSQAGHEAARPKRFWAARRELGDRLVVGNRVDYGGVERFVLGRRYIAERFV